AFAAAKCGDLQVGPGQRIMRQIFQRHPMPRALGYAQVGAFGITGIDGKLVAAVSQGMGNSTELARSTDRDRQAPQGRPGCRTRAAGRLKRYELPKPGPPPLRRPLLDQPAVAVADAVRPPLQPRYRLGSPW